MMKLNYYFVLNRKLRSGSEQERLLKFVGNKKTIEKAAEGSMNKRIEIFCRAGLKKSVI